MRDAVEIGGVDQLTGLLGDGAGHLRMGMAKAADGNAAERVQVLPALGVPEPDALAPLEFNREAGIGRHKMICHDCCLSKKEKAVCPRLPTG